MTTSKNKVLYLKNGQPVRRPLDDLDAMARLCQSKAQQERRNERRIADSQREEARKAEELRRLNRMERLQALCAYTSVLLAGVVSGILMGVHLF